MDMIKGFFKWWNGLAEENGKQEFRTHEEAAEFVAKVQRESGGPNLKIQAMREQYEKIRRARDQRTENAA
jgi:hypothetical protein